jgi:hypothetical protein
MVAGGADHRGGPVRLVARHLDALEAEDARDLVDDGGEDLRRRCAFGHPRRDPPQRRLLLGQATQVLAGLGLGDGDRGELGERPEDRLGLARRLGGQHDAPAVAPGEPGQPAGSLPAPGRHHPPDAPVDDDRRRDRGPDARGARRLGGRSGDRRVIVDPCRSAGLQHDRLQAAGVEAPAAADREPGIVERRDDDRVAVLVEAGDGDRRDVGDPDDLLGDGGELLVAGRVRGRQRRDAP